MRISDWSSDVCSSDLAAPGASGRAHGWSSVRTADVGSPTTNAGPGDAGGSAAAHGETARNMTVASPFVNLHDIWTSLQHEGGGCPRHQTSAPDFQHSVAGLRWPARPSVPFPPAR